MTEVPTVPDVIDVVPVSAETIPIELPSEVKVVTYDVTVTTKFQVTGPAEVPDPRLLERALWESMPAGYIGGDLFVKFPPGARNFNVKIFATEAIEEPVPAEVVEEKKEEKNDSSN